MRRRDLLFALLAAPLSRAADEESQAQEKRAATLWQIIKRALVAEDGREYFESSFKGAMVPGGADGVLMFKATVVWAEAADKPTKLVCGILDATTPEVTLQVKGSDGKPTALRRNVQPGSDVWFQGVVLDYSKDPFMVTFDVRLEDVRFESPGTMQKKRAIPLPKPRSYS